MTDTTAASSAELARLREELRRCRRELADVRAEQEKWEESHATLEYEQRQFIEMTVLLDQHFADTEGLKGGGRHRRFIFTTPFRPPSDREIRDMARLRATLLFDGAWYLRENPAVAASGVSPALHFLRRGRAERRNPGPDFDTLDYIKRHPKLPRKVNPLLHYLDSVPGVHR